MTETREETDVTEQSARPSQIPLLNLVNGFMAFKTLAAAVELDVFTALSGRGARTEAELAAELGLAPRPARVLLAALTSLELVERTGDGRYRNTPLAQECLVEGVEDHFGGFVQFYDRVLYPGWQGITEALRTDSPVFAEPEERDSVFEVDNFVMTEFFGNAMHAVALTTAGALAGAYDVGGHTALLDVGGSSGGFPIELCRRYPHLRATVYDLPHVCPVATKKVAAAGLEDRIGTAPGDLFTDAALPSGHDLIVLSQVLHCAGEERNRETLRKCFEALPPGGAVVVCELLLDPARSGPPAAALMGMNMLVTHDGGENYSETEYLGWLADTGFVDLEVVRFEAAGANGAVVGRRPA